MLLIHRKFNRNIIAVFLLFCLVNNANAVPVFNTLADNPLNNIKSTSGNLVVNDSFFYHYPWWANRGLHDSLFNESVPAQELKYSFLENTLYNFLGGSLVPYSIGYPGSSTKKYKNIQTIILPDKKYMDFWGSLSLEGKPAKYGDILSAYIENYKAAQYVITETGWYIIRIYRDDPSTLNKDGAIPGDYITFEVTDFLTGQIHLTETSLNLPVWTNHKDRIRVDINALPEPSTIVLFGFTALGFLRIKERN